MKFIVPTFFFLVLGVINVAAQTSATIGILQPLANKKTGKAKKQKGAGIVYIENNPLGFEMNVERAKLPNSAHGILLTVNVSNQALVFDDKNEILEASVNIFLRVLKLSEKSGGNFEEKFLIQINQNNKGEALKSASTYRKYFELPAGNYKIDVVLQDTKSGKKGIRTIRFENLY